MNNIVIMLECSCGIISPVTQTYFCRECVKIRCPICSEKDILSYYCDNCFADVSDNNVQSNEGKCLTCYDCPYCFNHLTLRMKRKKNTSADVSYYLTCSFCLWSTHEIDFPDQKSIASFRPLTKNESILNLIDYHKAVRWNQVSLLAPNLPLNIPRAKPPSVAEENSDMLPINIFNSSVNLSKITSVSQRLADPSVQPSNLNDFKPIRKQLKTVKLLRCLQCSHNLSLPEDKAADFFKVNRNCFYFVPRLKVVKFDPLRYDSMSEIILEVINCFPYNISVRFFQNLDTPKSILKMSLKKNVNVIVFPKIPLLLPPKFKVQSSNDGVRVRFVIQPNILANINEDSVFSFVMQYSYLNKNVQIPEIVRLNCKVFINLGKLMVL